MAISKRYQRIANSLRVFDLVGSSDADDDGGLLDDGFDVRPSQRFLDYYSREGIENAFEAYGVHETLESLGLGNYTVEISCDSGSRHRLQVLLDGIKDDDHRLIDFMVRTVSVRQSTISDGATAGGCYDMLLVEWLCLQNPHAEFSPERPRLPGQRYPGLGLGYAAHNMTLLVAQRLKKHGVMNVPEHFHLAVIYDRAGYGFVSRRHRYEVEAAMDGTRNLHLACAAWACERGLLKISNDEGQATDEVWVYEPAEMVAAASESFDSVMDSLKERIRRFRKRLNAPRIVVDLEELRQSLIDDPVEGIDPDCLG